MAMKFMDGFDYYNTRTQMLRKWDTVGTPTFTTGVYDMGQGILNPGECFKTLPGGNCTEGFFGMHITMPETFKDGSGIFTNSILRVYDGGVPGVGTCQVALVVDGTGAPLFIRGDNVFVGTFSDFRFVANTTYWVEVRLLIDPLVGVAELKVDGDFVLQNAGVNTQVSANSYFNGVHISDLFINSGSVVFDSFHFWDTNPGLSDYMGARAIITTMAASVGSNTDWDKGGSTINANNYQQVNEIPTDDGITFVRSKLAGNIDSYGFEALPQNLGAITAFAVNSVDMREDTVARTIKHYVKSGVTETLSASISPSSDWVNHQSIWEDDPDTGAVWTVDGVNNSQKGVKEIS